MPKASTRMRIMAQHRKGLEAIHSDALAKSWHITGPNKASPCGNAVTATSGGTRTTRLCAVPRPSLNRVAALIEDNVVGIHSQS